MTGHSLDHYLRLWDLRDPESLAQTPTRPVYTAFRDGEKGG
jgi:hypothetical protein